MLAPYLHTLNSKNVILGSQSKMRNLLMSEQQLKYERISSTYPQDLDKKSFPTPEAYNLQTCLGKVNELTQRFETDKKAWDLLICGDTIVYHKGEIIEKPQNEKHCIEMMAGLTNDTHQVYTANIVTFNHKIKNPDSEKEEYLQYKWVSKGDVTFGNIPKESFEAYAKTDEPYIHSGGYELTGVAASFIKSVSGSMTAVQGLDVNGVCEKILEGAKVVGWI